MKKFVVNVTLFVLPLLLLVYPADFFISHYLKKSNNFLGYEYPVWNDIFENKVDANIFIYGSSRAWVHLDPEVIGDSLGAKAYNFGVDGHTFRLQHLRHQIAVKSLPQPKLIIHSIDLITLMPQQDLYNYEQFLPYMLDRDDLQTPLLNFSGFEPIDFKVPLVRYYGQYDVVRESIGQFTGLDANQPVRIKGFRAEDKAWDGTFEQIRSKLKHFYVKYDPQVKRLFEQYLEECKQKNIKVILVYTPEYIEGQEFEINRAEVLAMYRQMAVKFDVLFLDYSKNEISYSKEYFYNAMHMNANGVDRFNRIFMEDLRKLGFKL